MGLRAFLARHFKWFNFPYQVWWPGVGPSSFPEQITSFVGASLRSCGRLWFMCSFLSLRAIKSIFIPGTGRRVSEVRVEALFLSPVVNIKGRVVRSNALYNKRFKSDPPPRCFICGAKACHKPCPAPVVGLPYALAVKRALMKVAGLRKSI